MEELKLKKKLPADRTFTQIKNHYLVEKALAEKLKTSSRSERKFIYETMYDELFERVPDHPRLSRRDSEVQTARATRSKYNLVKQLLSTSSVFMEFAAGDCQFSKHVAAHVNEVLAIDISDQRSVDFDTPVNMSHVVYDGFDLSFLPSSSVDVGFSDQLLEHFHPEDTELHFQNVFRLLKPGGIYIFRTPHPFTGPHDVSAYFSDEPEGFHLKEWTYSELKVLLKSVGFHEFRTRWKAKAVQIDLPYQYFSIIEKALSRVPHNLRKIPSKYLIPSLVGIAIK